MNCDACPGVEADHHLCDDCVQYDIEQTKHMQSQIQALRELVREFADEVIENGMPEHKCDMPEGAPPETFRSCDWCGAFGPQDPYAMTHNDNPEPCWAGQILTRAKAVTT